MNDNGRAWWVPLVWAGGACLVVAFWLLVAWGIMAATR